MRDRAANAVGRIRGWWASFRAWWATWEDQRKGLWAVAGVLAMAALLVLAWQGKDSAQSAKTSAATSAQSQKSLAHVVKRNHTVSVAEATHAARQAATIIKQNKTIIGQNATIAGDHNSTQYLLMLLYASIHQTDIDVQNHSADIATDTTLLNGLKQAGVDESALALWLIQSEQNQCSSLAVIVPATVCIGPPTLPGVTP